MKKFNVILIIIIAIAMSSCLTHYFAEPIPIDVQDYPSIPEPMLGVWNAEDETHTIYEDRWISEKIDSLGNKITKTEYELSDSLIVKRSGNNFFFNSLEENGYWTVYLGYNQNEYFFIKSLGATDTLTFVNSIGLEPDSTNKSKERYYNTPIPESKILKFINDGGFSDTLFVFDLKKRTIINDLENIP
jgi:hypothetical protein